MNSERGPNQRGQWALRTLLATALLLASCGQGDIEGSGGQADGVQTDPPVSALPDNQNTSTAPLTVADFFPATGSRGLVLNRCASCHSVGCTALGQRTPEQWAAVQETHIDAVPGLSIEDRTKIFDYLEANFSNTQPEPNIPPEFLEGGCPQL